MKKIFRWQGLLLFLAILGMAITFWFLLADTIARRAIEKSGTAIVGARVELSEAKLSLSPGGLTLRGLQVTNPDNPMFNLFEAERISFGIDLLPLFMKRFLVDEMTVFGLRFNTPRKTSGAVRSVKTLRGASKKAARKAVEKTLCGSGGFELPPFSMPDFDDILAKEKLESLAEIDTLRTSIKEEQAAWEAKLADLPNRKTFDAYQKRIRALKGSGGGGLAGMLGTASEAKTLASDIQKDLDLLNDAQREFKQVSGTLDARMSKLKAAPAAEAKRLLEKYAITPGGLKKTTRQLFGLHLCESVEKTWAWYKRIKPYIERPGVGKDGEGADQPKVVRRPRAKGVDVRFQEPDPRPDFLIRRLLASADINGGRFDGRIENLTPDQDLIGKPTIFLFEGENLPRAAALTLKGTLDHIRPGRAKDALLLVARRVKIPEKVLSANTGFPVTLAEAVADLKLETALSAGELTGELLTNFDAVRFRVPLPEEAPQTARIMANAIGGISKIDLKAIFSGPPQNPSIEVASNMDSIVYKAVASAIKGQSEKIEEQIKTSIAQKMEGPLGDLSHQFAGLDSLSKEFSNRLDIGDETLKSVTKSGAGGIKLPF